MVHTRKAQSGACRSRAVICGNYATATEQDVYAGGTDSTQVRTALKTAALMGWKVMGTDIRTAFLTAKRRDETKLVAMTIPVFRALGLAKEDEVWLVEMALYGLTALEIGASIATHYTLPQLMWRRTREDGVEVVGRFEKTADDNLKRPRSPRADDLLFCGEVGGFM